MRLALLIVRLNRPVDDVNSLSKVKEITAITGDAVASHFAASAAAWRAQLEASVDAVMQNATLAQEVFEATGGGDVWLARR